MEPARPPRPRRRDVTNVAEKLQSTTQTLSDLLEEVASGDEDFFNDLHYFKGCVDELFGLCKDVKELESMFLSQRQQRYF